MLGGSTLMEIVLLVEAPLASVTVTVAVYVPGAL